MFPLSKLPDRTNFPHDTWLIAISARWLSPCHLNCFSSLQGPGSWHLLFTNETLPSARSYFAAASPPPRRSHLPKIRPIPRLGDSKRSTWSFGCGPLNRRRDWGAGSRALRKTTRHTGQLGPFGQRIPQTLMHRTKPVGVREKGQRRGALLSAIGGTLSAVQAQCHYLGV